jgi:iron complex outermembrane recepter protein
MASKTICKIIMFNYSPSQNHETRPTRCDCRKKTLLNIALAIVLAAVGHSAWGQSTPDADPTSAVKPVAKETTQRLEAVIVTGNPFGRNAAGQPSSVLTGDELRDRQSGSLGETLSGLPGVSSSNFGPNASRPIIRGLDSERVRILENGASSVDAASLSPDHAVPIDPIAVERIEVLRGPAALFYGSSAIGGVVNAISNRIPSALFNAPTGTVALQGGGADRNSTGAAKLETSINAFSFHMDATRRKTEDLRVPNFTRPDDETADRVVNSAAKTTSAALGASYVNRDGYIGTSFDSYRSTYGTVVEEDVIIRMKRDKWTIAGEQRNLGGFIDAITGHAAFTRYQHEEVEGSGEIGTTFKNRGDEFRIEAKSRAYGVWRSLVGVSSETTRFSALGAEAFVPPSKTQSLALFGLQQGTLGAMDIALGARIERARIVTNEVFTDTGELRFGAADKKSLTLGSASAGFTHRLSAEISINTNLAYSERAPSFFERYANGVHIATGAYELGNINLPKEKSTNIDVGVNWKTGAHRAQITAFASRHRNFISLDATGNNFEETGADGTLATVPIYEFRAVPARFYGVEAESSWRVLDGRSKLDMIGKFDMVRAKNSDSGEPLPRIAPMRFTLGANYQGSDWALRSEVMHVAKQSRIPFVENFVNAAGNGTTKSFSTVNVSFTRSFKWDRVSGLAFLRGTNLTNALGYSASVIRNVRELSPLPGRGIRAGIELSF